MVGQKLRHYKLVRRFIRQECGVAAIEFALIAPVLLILLIGVINLGFRYFEQARLDQVTRETAEAALFIQNISILQQTLNTTLNKLGAPISGTPYTGLVERVCRCDGAVIFDCTVSQAQYCNSTGLPWEISIDISAQMEYQPIMTLFGNSETLVSTIRLQSR